MSLPQTIYRAALRICPEAFRDEYGESMSRDFGELVDAERRDGGRFSVLVLTLRSLVDLCRTAYRERRTRERAPRPRAGAADVVRQHLRDAFRAAFAKPGFSLLVIATLALGIGANSAIFETVYAVVLKPLPFPEADRLVVLHETDRARGGDDNDVTPANLEDWRRTSTSFDGLAAFTTINMNLTGLAEPEQLSALRVSGNFLQLLGTAPLLGRSVGPEDDTPGAPPVVMLANGFWQRRFGGDPGVLGDDIRLDDVAHRVVGILPPWFLFPSRDHDLFVPLAMDEEERSARQAHYLSVFGRLSSGVSLDAARQEMDAIALRLEEAYPNTNAENGVALKPLASELVAGLESSLMLLLGAVGAVLLVAVVNVASLLLARSASRLREVAVKSALGASRARILTQSLMEALLLSSCGGALGLLVARATSSWLGVLVPGHVAVERSMFQPATLVFAGVLTVAVALGMGLLPALSLSRTSPTPLFHDRGLRQTASRAFARLRSLLVTSEVALALVLTILGGLMVRSFVNLSQVEPGFHAESLLTMKVELSGSRYSQHAQKVAFFRELEERIARLPGVVSSGVVSMLPLTASGGSILFQREDRPPEPGVEPLAVFRSVSPGYFRTMGIRMLTGRAFDDRDRADSVPTAVVSETLARTYFPDVSPVGQRIDIWGTGTEIVGVVSDVRQLSFGDASRPAIYVAMAQRSFGYFDPKQLAVRTDSDPEALAQSVRAEVWAIDADQPVASIRTMEDIVSGAVADEKLRTWLYSLFGAIALLLAVVGVYGVSSYAVVNRKSEIGLRMALGARRADVVGLLVSHGMRLVVAGIVIGLAVTTSVVGVVDGFLFDVQPFDPWVFAGAAGLLALTALVATSIPAMRAARIDPLTSLRVD